MRAGVYDMDVYEKSLELHAKLRGKYEVRSLVEVKDRESLSLAYTPGVAQPCREIAKDPSAAYTYTRKWNTVAVVSDGSAVLGLGNIGGLAGLPVMEGKAILFREFAGIDSVPIVLSGQDEDDIVRAVEMIAPTFGGINLEDICAPKCFAVEKRLKEKLDIPVFHDDQHGTAIVVTAALLNALKLAEKQLEKVNIVICGAGSAGIAICKLLLESGAQNVTLTDRLGIVCEGETWLTDAQADIAKVTNRAHLRGTLADAVRGAGRVYRRFQTRTADPRNGLFHGGKERGVCHGKPRARDLPAGRAGGGRLCRRHGQERFSQPDQQRSGLSRGVPRRAGRARKGHFRGHESGRGARPGRACGGGPRTRQHHPFRV